MLLSTPEGADKPAKYPLMFQESAALLINKIDLIPYVDFDLKKAKRDALSLHKDLKIFEVSCKTAAGLDAWTSWLTKRIDAFKK
jgi:hydrogenase nickel incorporation protein HypB